MNGAREQQAQPWEWMNNQPVMFWELRAAFGDEDPCWKLWGSERPAEDALFQFVENPNFTFLQLLTNVINGGSKTYNSRLVQND